MKESKPQWIKDLEAATARFEVLADTTKRNAETFVAELKADKENRENAKKVLAV